MLKRLIALGLGLGAMVTALPAHAEDCAARDQVVERLSQEFAEQLTAGGLHDAATDAGIVEVWASPKTGTFTVMLTNAYGVSCILATGTNWVAQDDAHVLQDTSG